MFLKLDSIARLFKRNKLLRNIIEVSILCALIGVFIVTTGRALKRIAIQQIAEFTNTHIRTASVNFDFDGSVYIEKLIVEPSNWSKHDNAILKAQRVNAHFDVISLLTFHPRLKQITIDDFEFNAVYNQDTKHWNLATLRIQPPKGTSGRMPSVELKAGKLRYTKVTAGQSKIAFEVPVDAKFGFDEKTHAGYSFEIATAQMQGGFGKSNLKGYWQPGRITIAGGVSSADIAAFETVWIVNLFAGQIDYDLNNNFNAELRIKDLVNKDRGFDKAHRIEYTLLSKKFGLLRVLQKFITQYRPVGKVDLTLTAGGKLDQLHDTTLRGSVDCKGVSILYDKFPYRVDELKGTIDFTETGVSLNDLSGRHEEVELFFNGSAKGFGKEHEYQIQIISENMLLDDKLHDALGPRGKKFWATFSPSGTAAINYTSMRDCQGKKSALAVKITDANAVYEHFPYPLKNLTGTLMFGQNIVTLSEVTSLMGRRKVILNGNVISNENDQSIYDISIKADNIPFDQTLTDALPKGQEYFYSQYDLTSFFDKDMELYLDARIWTTDEIDKPFYQLLLSLDNLDLNEKSFSVLPEAMKKVVDRLKPQGKINLAAFLNRLDTSDEPDYKVMINCLGNSVELGGFEYPLKDITGQVAVTKDNITLTGIRATAGDVIQIGVNKPTVKINGQILISEKGFLKGSFEIDANDILLNEQLCSALPENAVSHYQKIAPKGRFDLNKMNVQAVTGPDGINNITFDGAGAMTDCQFENLGVITGFDGKFDDLKTSFRSDKGFADLEANLSDGKLRVRGKTLNKLKADIYYDKKNKKWLTEDFTGQFYGGKVVGTFELDSLQKQYVLQTGFSDVDLKELLSDTDRESETADSYSTGLMEGALNVTARMGDTDSRIGRCRLVVEDMQVGKLSPLAKLMMILQLNDPKDYAFDQMVVDSYIKGDNMYFDCLDVSGNALAFTGTGNMDLKTEDVDLVLNARGKRLAMTEPKGLASLTEGLRQAVIRIEVDGNIYDPNVKTKTLPIIKDAIGLIGQKP
ncbi:hypothetical protein ACFL3G_12190 [Planctomycetota bacterium]